MKRSRPGTGAGRGSAGAGPPGRVRLIAGQWRGRRLTVLPGSGVRPTPDRVRETLFNWLMPVLPGARCLDLYAGTGALGLEALSRGAAEAWFVEADPRVAAALDNALATLRGHGRVVRADVSAWLRDAPPTAFDVLFLDPPYGDGVLDHLCTLLTAGWLAEQARIYLETSRDRPLPLLPPGWELLKENTAGEVRFGLACRRSGSGQ